MSASKRLPERVIVPERAWPKPSALPFWAQVAIGFLVLQFGVYWWHRTMHHSDTLWRVFHQMHHSAERVDI